MTGSNRSAAAFFAIVFVPSVPFWIAGAGISWQLMPGLPFAAFAFVVPSVAAAVLLYRESGFQGVRALLARSFDWRRIPSTAWYVPIVLLKPAIGAASFAWMRAAGVPVPSPRFSIGAGAALSVAFFVAALGEELGWSAFAVERMQQRSHALVVAASVGLISAIWHWIPLIEAKRAANWIAWWSLGTVASRVVAVWIFNGTRQSVFAAALFHATSNLSWQLFPNNGSHWDPRINALITSLATLIVAAVGRGALPAPASSPSR